MANISEQKGRRLLRRLLVAAGLLLALSAIVLVGLLIGNSRRFAPRNVALRDSLIGTWAGDHGVILHFRADGTARSRSLRHPSPDFSYFEWTVTGKHLEAFYGSRQHTLRWTINRYVIGRPSSRYKVQFLAPDQFPLTDAQTERTLRFTKTSDADLEEAP